MLVINAFTLSTDQYCFMIRMLFVNLFCLYWALNVMIIKFYHSNSCLTIVENCKSCWICCMNFAVKFFNIFCCLNTRSFTTFNFSARVSSFFTFSHYLTMTTMFSNCLFSIAISLFIIVNFKMMRYLINWWKKNMTA